MDFDLWEKVLWYTSYKKYYVPKGPISDKVLFKKVTEKFIINKFLEIWINRNQDDPIDILDGMLVKYSMWEDNAIKNNNKNTIKIYDTYIKTLIGVKNYIQKEQKI